MGLIFPVEWKFEGIGITVPLEAISDLDKLAVKIAAGAEYPQTVYETFKSRFGNPGSSSNESWAAHDMREAMTRFASNAAEFVDAYWSAICDTQATGLQVPQVETLNKILHRHGIALIIDPPNLRRVGDSFLISENNSRKAGNQSNGMIYNLKDKIGEGAFGQVFRAARHSDFVDFEVAVKILNPSAFIRDRDKALARFRREVKILQALQHRAIVPYLDAGQDSEGRPFLVMPFIDGKPIRDAVPRADAATAIKFMVDILDGLRYAHSKEILHRDLKPSNILVRNSDRQPIIVDFGAAYLFEEALGESLTTSLIGSLGYIPHEVMADPKIRTVMHDIYSCGVILYEIIAGRRPDPRDYQPLSIISEPLGAVDNIVLRALAPARSRYQSTDDFIRELDSLSSQ